MGSWSYRNIYLCHGGAALKGLRILGGDEGRKALHEVLDGADAIIDKHNGTPWEVLVRRGAIALYQPGGD
jgi:hypothetical protein